MQQLELSYSDGKNVNLNSHLGMLQLKMCDPEITLWSRNAYIYAV